MYSYINVFLIVSVFIQMVKYTNNITLHNIPLPHMLRVQNNQQ